MYMYKGQLNWSLSVELLHCDERKKQGDLLCILLIVTIGVNSHECSYAESYIHCFTTPADTTGSVYSTPDYRVEYQSLNMSISLVVYILRRHKSEQV